MARALVDLQELDLTKDVLSDEELRSYLPHAYEFKMVDGICHLDLEKGIIIGYKDWDQDPWWARGHIPGRPLMPGVLMVEGCAQVCTVLMKRWEGWSKDQFVGLGGLENVRFRRPVGPSSRVHYVSVAPEPGRRLPKYPSQCFHENKIAMEMELIGVKL